MRTVFETCKPRPEVLSGELRDEMFAARLKDVVDGTADAIYQDARRFFENTYPTEGLKTLIREVMGRLSGKEPANSPFVRLETSFGGGKTHNLIALHHLAQGHKDGVPKSLVDHAWIPSKPWPTAGLVGSDMDPANGIDHDGLRTWTLWGELAWQIGRFTVGSAAAYEIVRASDEQRVAPGTQVLEKLLGGGPALVMLDEVAHYLRKAKAVSTANGKSDVAEQSVAFLMTLIEFAASKPQIAVVVTLADSKDAFAEETDVLRLELSEARRVSARQERVITPTGETEISKIVTHRLFESIDPKAAAETADAYHQHFLKLDSQGVEIAQNALRGEYAAELRQDYPFHPELLTTLNRKTATIPNFQKTRGALRLLARVVRRFWEQRPKDGWLIAVHNIDLGKDDIANDLTSRLERPAFRSVIEADIVSPRPGSISHAQAIDRRFEEAGRPPFARRAATNILLHSLTQGTATGIELSELVLSVLQPGDDAKLLENALATMLGEGKGDPGTAFWFLHWDAQRYRFKTEPSLEKVVQDEIPLVGRIKAKNELDERIAKIWKKGTFKPVWAPSEAADLDDDAQLPKLAILHYDAASTTLAASDAPDLVTKLFDHAGSMQGYRTYKNNVLFLAADKDHVDRMVDIAQRHLAVARIVNDSTRMSEFSEDQRKKLRGIHDASEMDVRIAITRAYKYLYYPSADAPKKANGLAREVLPAQEQGDINKDQGAVVLRVLKQLDKVLTADDPAMPPAYVKAKAWPHGQPSMTTEDLRREFGKRIGLRILLDVNQLKKTIRTGCSNGAWIYFDATEQIGYGAPSPAPMVEFSEDAVLYEPDEAKRLGLRIKGDEAPQAAACPLCGKAECECGGEGAEAGEGGGGTAGAPTRLKFKEEGPPAQVFQKIADHFHDAGRTTIRRLVLRCEGMGKESAADARAIGLAIPQLGKGSFRVEQSMTAEFGMPPNADSFSVTFQGAWDRYKRVKQLTDAFGQEASKVTVRTVLSATFEEGLIVTGDQFQSLRDIFTQLAIGKMSVDVEEAFEEVKP